jgi:CHAD domain-containing protein
MNDKPAVRPDGPVGDALLGAVRDVLGDARAALDDPGRTDAVAVHDYRKAMKRWRALLRLLAPFAGDDAQRLRHEARDLARELAGARDAQSALDAVDDLGEVGEALTPGALAAIRRRLGEVKQEAEDTALTEAMRGRLRAALTAAELSAGSWPLSEVEFSEVARELTVAYARARAAIPDEWATASAEQLHELRGCVVTHRYQMELVEPLWPRLGKLWIGEAQRLRDRLGTHHDLEMLAGLVAPHKLLARWRSRLVPLIRTRQAAHVAAATRLSARLFAERPKAFRRRLEALWQART